MSAIFLSHSSKDDDVTRRIAARLEEHGHRSVFLDFDPDRGIPPGRNWEKELYQQLRACRAVVVLCSEHSMESDWCFAEITHARALGKHVIPVKVSPCMIREVLSGLQVLDLINDPDRGFRQLWRGLEAAGLDPADIFNWDGRRSPYPGLMAFQEEDAAVFFGRDGAIREGLDFLNRLQRFEGARLAVFLGASGSGKSSLVRAGLLPRLRRDPVRWLVLRPFRPLQRPLDELAIVLTEAFASFETPRDWKTIRDQLGQAADVADPDDRVLINLARDLRSAAGQHEATVLLNIDQFEEVLSYAPEDQASRFLPLVCRALKGSQSPLIAVATLRSDFLGDFQEHPELRDMAFESVSVGPMSVEGLTQVIEGPADVAGVALEPGLVQAMVADTETEDSLPMLAFTLRELWEHHRDDALLTNEQYRDRLGGIRGSVARAADAVLAASQLTAAQEADLRDAFVSMVRINDEGQYVRRAVRWGDLPQRIHTLLERFVQARLLVSQSEGEGRILEVAHEALFRTWHRLKAWLDEDRESIRLRDGIRRAAEEWSAGGRVAPLLVHRGSRLDDAESVARQPRFALVQLEREYLEACTNQRKAEQEDARRRREAEAAAKQERLEREAERQRLEAKAATEREIAARRIATRTRIGAAFAASLALLATAFGWYGIDRSIEAERQRDQVRETELQRTSELFESQLTHASLLARVEDYAAARAVLNRNRELDTNISAKRRRARDFLARFLETMGGAARQTYTGANATLFSVAVSPDGQLLAASGENATLVLFDVESGELIQRLQGHKGSIWDAVFDPQGHWLVTGDKDGKIIQWSLRQGAESATRMRTWTAPAAVHSLAVSLDGRLIASGGPDKNISLWDADTGSLVRRLRGHKGWIADNSGLAFSPSGKMLASASYDNTARLWDVESGNELKVLQWHSERVLGVAFSPDGERIATSSEDDRVVLWDVDSGKRLQIFSGHDNPVVGVAFTPDTLNEKEISGPNRNSSILLSSSHDRTIRLWDPDSGVTRRIFQGHSGGVMGLHVHVPQKTQSQIQVFSASTDGTIRRWDVAPLPHQQLVDMPGPADSVAISPDGQLVAVGFEDGGLRLYSLPKLQLLSEQKRAHRDTVRRISFSVDSRFLASASHDRTAKIWAVSRGEGLVEKQTFSGHRDTVYSLAISPDSQTLATASYDGQVGLFVVGSSERRFFSAHKGVTASVVFDDSGAKLLSSGQDRAVRLWDLRTDPPTLLREFPAKDALMWAALSPSGQRIASVGRNYVVETLWAHDGQRDRELLGHEQTVFRATFSPDGQQLATVSADHTVRFWDLEAGGELFELRLPSQGFQAISDFDFRCTPINCWLAVPLTLGAELENRRVRGRGRLAIYNMGELAD